MTDAIVVPPERAGLELDELLCLHFPGAGKGFLRSEIRAGRVLLDGQPTYAGKRVRADQVVLLDIDFEAAPGGPRGEDVRLPVLHEDDALLVVDKPTGLAVEPERWFPRRASVAGAVLTLARERSDGEDGPLAFRPRVLHRLDKDTSGALAVAKTIEAERALRAAFEEGGVRKEYRALVEGEHPLADGEEETIDLPLAPASRRSSRMAVAREGEGKPARTLARVVERFAGFTWLAAFPLTGRTHQIRVHLAAQGFPLAVDPLYGRRDELFLSEIKDDYRPKKGAVERPLLGRLALHASSLELPDVARGEGVVRVEAPLPKDLARTLKQLAKVRPFRAPPRRSR